MPERLSPVDVRAAFRRIRATVDHRHVDEPEPYVGADVDPVPLDGPIPRSYLERIETTLTLHPRFAERYDYWWAADVESYDMGLELSLQCFLIETLANANLDHPSWRRLKPIAIRCVRNPHVSSMCLPGVAVDFVCMTQGLLKFLQVMIGSLIDFHDSGSRFDAMPTTLCETNLICGQDAERTLRYDPQAGMEICRRIAILGQAAAQGLYIAHHSPITDRLQGDIAKSNPILMSMYNATEAFIVFHEVGHLVMGHQPGSPRSIQQEFEADIMGTKLMITASAIVPELPAGVMYGPPFFYQAFRIYGLMRQVTAVVEGHPDLDVVSAPEGELAARMDLVESCVAREVRVVALYRNVIRELAMVALGCKQYLLGLMGVAVSLDEVVARTRRAGNPPSQGTG